MKIVEVKVYCDECAKIDDISIIDELEMDISISINDIYINISEIKAVYLIEGLIGGLKYAKQKVFCYVNECEYSIFGKYIIDDDGELYLETKYGFRLSNICVEEMILQCLRCMSKKNVDENYNLSKAIALFYARVKANEFIKNDFHAYMIKSRT